MKQRKPGRRERHEEFDDEAYVKDVLYKDGHCPPQRKRKKRKGKKRRGVFLGLLTFVLGIVIIVFAFLLLFHVQKIEVKGNRYCTENEVIGWIKEDKYAVNSIYAWWKYNQKDVKQLPVVESSKITFNAPWHIKVTVKEKEITGYIDYNNQYLYFDKDGTALQSTTEKVEGAAYIEGMDVDASKVKMGKVLSVSDEDVFDRIVEISQLLVKHDLTPDRITCNGSELNLYFGKVEVLLGKKNYEDRLLQVPPILAKLKENFPDKEGTLHLENYEALDKAVRFVPKEAEENDGQPAVTGEEGIDAQPAVTGEEGIDAQPTVTGEEGIDGQPSVTGAGEIDDQDAETGENAGQSSGTGAQDSGGQSSGGQEDVE